MTYDPSTIRSNLKTLLQTVTEIQYVYDYFNPNIEGYPAIIFDISNNDNQMLTDTENLRKITFSIYILVEVSVVGQSEAKRILDVASKQVITALEKITNISLSGSVDWIMPTLGKRQQFETPEGATMSQELILDVKVSSSIL